MAANSADTLIVAQSGGPTPVINASLAGVLHAARKSRRIGRVYGLINGLEGAVRDNVIDLGQEPAQTIDRLLDTPAAILGSGRYRVAASDYARIISTFQSYGVGYFINIGGNGSMAVTHTLAKEARQLGYDLAVIGVPKTIDNDLVETDHAPGYGSAARFLALATRDTGRDLESMVNFDDVIILEAMGRDAGWLAAAAGLGKVDRDEAPHLIYVPEIPFDPDQFLADVAALHRRLGRVFVVVSEGLRSADGQFIGQPTPTDPMGQAVHSLMTGVSTFLVDLIREKLHLQARTLRPGLIGRAMSVCVSPVDRQEAYQVGWDAVNRVVAGQDERMVVIRRVSNEPYRIELGTIPLIDVAGRAKAMPRDFMNAAGTMISPAFVDYALPLIGGALPPLARLKRSAKL